MNLQAKKILLIDLDKKISEIKSFSELNNYIGGVGLALKLFQMYKHKDPVIFAVGPLSGLFPYASKTCVVLENDDVVEDLYVGGTLASRIKFSGVDALVIIGKSDKEEIINIRERQATFITNTLEDINELGLKGKRTVIAIKENGVFVDDYFTTPDTMLEEKLRGKNLKGIVITGSENYTIKDFPRYTDIYMKILLRVKDISTEKGNFPACSGCPMGCEKSRDGEMGGNILIHSLVACDFAKAIYSDIGVVFSCLNVLGYHYTHEDIENLPHLIEETFRKKEL